MDGMQMMLKSMGIDTDKIVADFTQLKDGVIKTLTGIDERLARLETLEAKVYDNQTQIINLLQETNPVLLGDLDVIKKLAQEITAWKRQQVTAQLLQVTAQQPPKPQPPMLQDQPMNQPPESQPQPST